MAKAPPEQPTSLLVILAGLVGNMMEWFDFAVYGNFAIIIGTLFFPSTDPRVSLIASFGAFAAGFLARPLGGIVFGRMGDVFGRQTAMLVSICAMSLPTIAISILPGFEQWGIWAPACLITLRIIQGLSVGGEYTSSLVFLSERSGRGHRARNSVWGLWGAVFGMLLGSLLALGLASLVGEDAMKAWGWRALFATGGVVALAGILIRRLLPPEINHSKTDAPITELLRDHKRGLVYLFLINIGGAAAFYTVMVYAVTYVRTMNTFDRVGALQLNIFAMALMLAGLPVAAWMADRFGLRRVLVWGLAFSAVASLVLFQCLVSQQVAVVYLAEAAFACIVALLLAGLVSYNVDVLPRHVRCTGLAIAYNAAVGLFGGITPMMATWLIDQTGDKTAPAYWLSAALAVSLGAVLLHRSADQDRAHSKAMARH